MNQFVGFLDMGFSFIRLVHRASVALTIPLGTLSSIISICFTWMAEQELESGRIVWAVICGNFKESPRSGFVATLAFAKFFIFGLLLSPTLVVKVVIVCCYFVALIFARITKFFSGSSVILTDTK